MVKVFVLTLTLALTSIMPVAPVSAAPQREDTAWAQWVVRNENGGLRGFVVVARDVHDAQTSFSEVWIASGPCKNINHKLRCALRRDKVEIPNQAFHIDALGGAELRFRWRGAVNFVEWFDAQPQRGAYLSECNMETTGAGIEAHTSAKGNLFGTALSVRENDGAAVFTGVTTSECP